MAPPANPPPTLPPTLRLGTLTAKGGGFAFEAAKGPFEARAGEEAEFALLYTFEEASREREQLRVRLTLDLGGQRVGACQVEVHDRPFVKDVVRGNLSLLAKVPRGPKVEGAFVVEALYAVGGWAPGEVAKDTGLREAHRFEVRVR